MTDDAHREPAPAPTLEGAPTPEGARAPEGAAPELGPEPLVDPGPTPTPAPVTGRPPAPAGMPDYRGEELDAERGPGLGCFWVQVILLAVFVVLTPLTAKLGWPPIVSAILLFITLGLLLFVGQTVIFLLRIVAAERRGRRRPLASASRTVGEIEDTVGAPGHAPAPGDAVPPGAASESGDGSEPAGAASAPARTDAAAPPSPPDDADPPSPDGGVRQ